MFHKVKIRGTAKGYTEVTIDGLAVRCSAIEWDQTAGQLPRVTMVLNAEVDAEFEDLDPKIKAQCLRCSQCEGG